MILMTTLLNFLALATAFGAMPELDLKLGKALEKCKASPQKQHVWIFKQWHLGPSINTRFSTSPQTYPQGENQAAIFEQLSRWIEAGALQSVYAEGCANSEITESFKPAFNGWTVADLKRESKNDDYSKVVSSIPMKIEAKYGDRIKTVCIDNDELLKKHAIAFSDARGTSGFLSRIDEHKGNPKKAKIYIEGAQEVFKWKGKISPEDAIKRLKQQLKADLSKIEKAGDTRSDAIAKNVVLNERKTIDTHQSALIVGGSHTTEVMTELEKQGIGCTVVEPTGYSNDDARLMESLKSLVK